MNQGINRREFLYYLLGGSFVLLAAEAGAAAYWYAEPNLPPDFNLIQIDPGKLPTLKSTPPIIFLKGGFWLSNTRKGLLAFSIVCPFIRQRCAFKWVDVNNRFECPCCGSKFQADGTYIEGIAYRDLDRFVVYAKTPTGINKTPEDGSPVNIEGATAIYVDVGHKILGQPSH